MRHTHEIPEAGIREVRDVGIDSAALHLADKVPPLRAQPAVGILQIRPGERVRPVPDGIDDPHAPLRCLRNASGVAGEQLRALDAQQRRGHAVRGGAVNLFARAAETDAVFVLLHLAQKALVLARAGGEQLPLRQAAPVAVEREKLRVARKGALRSLEVDVPLAAAQAARHGVEFPVLAGKVLTRLHAAGDRVTVRVKIRNFVHNSPQNASSRYSMRVAAALCAVSV